MREAALFFALLVIGTAVGAVVTSNHARDGDASDALAPASADAAPPQSAAKGAPHTPPLLARGSPTRLAPAHAIHLNDSLGTTAAVCTGASGGGCTSFPSSEKRSLLIAQGDSFGAFDINITWSPSAPLTQRLDVALRACPSLCRGGEPVLASAIGIAPLRLQDALPFVPTGERIYLEVSPAMPGPSVGAVLRASTPQPFHVDGTVMDPMRS